MNNTVIWDALGKTDPAHTKAFNRSGGFKGTAIKPIWILRKLTEQFGAAGIGWGVNEPQFQVVPAEGEILVYCTVSAWHGTKDNTLWGVGGDKVQAKRSGGSFCDDEAFKKAFTDAINNAFKSIGVGADVHMGQFDDDKYVADVGREFEEKKKADQPPSESLKLLRETMAENKTRADLNGWLRRNKPAIDMLEARELGIIEAEYVIYRDGLPQPAQVAA
jgi:hypothetical protein